MTVIFHTNIDAYNTNCFPEYISIPPRIGEKVSVVEAFGKHFINQKLPTSLEVVDVTWTDHGVICELHYSKIDLKKFDVLKQGGRTFIKESGTD